MSDGTIAAFATINSELLPEKSKAPLIRKDHRGLFDVKLNLFNQ